MQRGQGQTCPHLLLKGSHMPINNWLMVAAIAGGLIIWVGLAMAALHYYHG